MASSNSQNGTLEAFVTSNTSEQSRICDVQNSNSTFPLYDPLKTSKLRNRSMIFTSHSAASVREAVKFKELLLGSNPKIFVFRGIKLTEARYPIVGIHWIDTGDTNRWKGEFKKMGFEIDDATAKELAQLFRQTR